MNQYRFAANDKKSVAIYESHSRQMIRNFALALAIIFSILALYFCLVPALANEGSRYIYFDNGISMYNMVEYSVDGGKNYQLMTRLSEGGAQPANWTNVNSDFVYVTDKPIDPTQSIMFRGTASGTVYDSVSNYQIDSASREWGYDYVNFQWISDPISVAGDWDCYFAPAKAMQYKYNGQKEVNGQTITEDFILPVNWAQKTVNNFFTLDDFTDESCNNFTKNYPNFLLETYNLGGIFKDNQLNTFSDGRTFNKQIQVNNGISANRYIKITPKITGILKVYIKGYSDTKLKVFANNSVVYESGTFGDISDAIECPVNAGTEYNIEIERGDRCFWLYGIDVTNTSSYAATPQTMIGPLPEIEAEPAEEETVMEAEVPMEGTVGFVEDIVPEEEMIDEETAAEEEIESADSDEQTAESADETEALEEQSAEEEQLSDEESVEEANVAEEEVVLEDEAVSILNDEIQVIAADSSVSILNASALNIEEYSAEKKINDYFSIMATESNKVSIDGNTKSIDGMEFTKRIKLGSTGKITHRSIKFTAAEAGYVRVYAMASSGDAAPDRFLCLLNDSGTVYTALEPTDGGTIKRFDLTFDKGGTYYIASAKDGINIYYVALYYGAVDSGSNNGSTAYFSDADKVLDIDSLTGSGLGTYNDIFTITDGCWVNTSASGNGSGTSTDGKQFSSNIHLQSAGGKDYCSIKVTPTQAGRVVIYASTNGSGKELWILNSGGQTVATESVGGFAQPIPIVYEFDTTSTFYIASDGFVRIYAVAVYYTDAPEPPPSDPAASGYHINPENGDNRTFYGYTYVMGGITGHINDVNSVGSHSQAGGAEGSYALGNGTTNDGKIHGLTAQEYKDAFKAKATFYDYFSDWELSGQKLDDHENYYEGLKGDSEADSLYRNITGNSYPITFSEGTNTVSYTYQGDLWNQAIRDYYSNVNFPKEMSPLYFGSNSWFTGNGRYVTQDRYGTAFTLPTRDKINGTRIDSKGVPKPYSGYVYDIPSERAYIDANGYLPFSNEASGLSNSRAYSGLVNLNDTGDAVQLIGSGKDTPYFNQSFLEGDNTKNTVYGKVYKDVSFEFKYNSESGYYEYDSTLPKYATRLTLNQKTGKYYMDYTGVGVRKGDGKYSSETNYQFYPFNSSDANEDFYRENLMFGMKLQIPFMTYQDANRRTGIFKFSGDDDVWVYIDKTLALDIGGTHTAVGGVIDMKTGYAVVGSTYKTGTGENGNAMSDSITDKEKAAFAISTMDGVYSTNGSKTVVKSNFFDDTFTPVGNVTYTATVGPENGKTKSIYTVKLNGTITYDYYDSNGDSQTATLTFTNNDTFTFVLTDLTGLLTGEDTGSDDKVELEGHNLNIYYMERGLNSSNFKIAFKLAYDTERSVKKVWADGEENHLEDKVLVDLYRTIDTPDGGGDVNCDFETGNDGWSGNGEYVAAERTQEIQHGGSYSLKASNRSDAWKGLQYPLDSSRYTAGESYRFGVWAQYRRNPSDIIEPIYHEDFAAEGGWSSRGGDAVKVWASGRLHYGREGFNNNSLGVGSNNNSAGRTAHWHGAVLSLDSSQYIPGNEYSFSVYVTHNSADEGGVDGDVTYGLTLIYNLPNVTDPQYDSIATVKTGTKVWGQLANSRYPIPENAYNLQLSVETLGYIDGNPIVNTFYIDEPIIAEAGAVIDGTTVTKGTVSNLNLTLRYTTSAGNTDWQNIKTVSASASTWYRLEDDIVFPEGTDYCLIVDTGAGNTADIYIDDAFIEVPFTYSSDVIWVGSATVELTKDNMWQHTWTGLLESEEITVQGEVTQIKYTYFIREQDVTINGVKYRASYYDAETGKKLEPDYITYEGQTIKVYPCDSKIDFTEVVNIPLTDLVVKKDWHSSLSDKTKPITVTVYSDVNGGTEVGTLTISGDSWTASLKELPLWQRNAEGECIPIKYYGVEDDPGEGIEAFYHSTEFIEVDGKRAYRFTEETVNGVKQLKLWIDNKPDNLKAFALQLQKRSSADGSLIEGASFALYESDDGGVTYKDTPVSEGRTNAGGGLQFGNSGFEVGKYYKLVETRAAPGYTLNNVVPIVFCVTESLDGKLVCTVIEPNPNDNKFLTKAETKEIDGTWVLTFSLQNDPYTIVMPSTGGGGIVWLFAGAFGMIGLSLVLLVFAERRVRRQDR